MNMKSVKISKTLLAVMLGSALVSGSALAEETTMDKAQNSANSAGQKIDSSMNKVGNFMDDSAITAKVKAGRRFDYAAGNPRYPGRDGAESAAHCHYS
jgi:hyperosmotically inducible protein